MKLNPVARPYLMSTATSWANPIKISPLARSFQRQPSVSLRNYGPAGRPIDVLGADSFQTVLYSLRRPSERPSASLRQRDGMGIATAGRRLSIDGAGPRSGMVRAERLQLADDGRKASALSVFLLRPRPSVSLFPCSDLRLRRF